MKIKDVKVVTELLTDALEKFYATDLDTKAYPVELRYHEIEFLLRAIDQMEI